jgi:hypothetical protein
MEYDTKYKLLDDHLDNLINSGFSDEPNSVKSFEKIKQDNLMWPKHHILLDFITEINNLKNEVWSLRFNK